MPGDSVAHRRQLLVGWVLMQSGWAARTHPGMEGGNMASMLTDDMATPVITGSHRVHLHSDETDGMTSAEFLSAWSDGTNQRKQMADLQRVILGYCSIAEKAAREVAFRFALETLSFCASRSSEKDLWLEALGRMRSKMNGPSA